MKHTFFLLSILILHIFTSALNATEYTNTSYYVAYDENDKTQFALVMPSVNKVYTHKAGEIEGDDLSQIDTQFKSFPIYDKGELCFSALKENASGEYGASVMAGKCYRVDFFYTQKEVVQGKGVAFILTYTPLDKVYEGLAGDAESFKVVRDGDTVQNENSVTGDDYTLFRFDVVSSKVVSGGEELNSKFFTTEEIEEMYKSVPIDFTKFDLDEYGTSGSVTIDIYTPSGLLQNLKETLDYGEEVTNWIYTYNEKNLLVNEKDTGAWGYNTSINYTYDNQDRLIKEVETYNFESESGEIIKDYIYTDTTIYEKGEIYSTMKTFENNYLLKTSRFKYECEQSTNIYTYDSSNMLIKKEGFTIKDCDNTNLERTSTLLYDYNDDNILIKTKSISYRYSNFYKGTPPPQVDRYLYNASGDLVEVETDSDDDGFVNQREIFSVYLHDINGDGFTDVIERYKITLKGEDLSDLQNIGDTEGKWTNNTTSSNGSLSWNSSDLGYISIGNSVSDDCFPYCGGLQGQVNSLLLGF